MTGSWRYSRQTEQLASTRSVSKGVGHVVPSEFWREKTVGEGLYRVPIGEGRGGSQPPPPPLTAARCRAGPSAGSDVFFPRRKWRHAAARRGRRPPAPVSL
ncbi:unnamed protein product [Bubo scandiacus]